VTASSPPGIQPPIDPDVAGRFACWLAASIGGVVDDARALAAVERGSAGHVVEELPGMAAQSPLRDVWPLLVARRPYRLAVILPAPGGTLPVAGNGPFARAALDAGAGVLLESSGGRIGLVPQRDLRGSSYLGYRWRAFTEDPAHLLDDAGLADGPGASSWALTAELPAAAVPRAIEQTDRALRRAIRAATETLAEIDLAQWRPEVVEGGAAADLALRTTRDRLPPGWPPPARALLERALGLWRVLQVAVTAPGGVSSSGSAIRDAALRELSHEIRESLMVAYNAPLHVLLADVVERAVQESG
jgi:hypothetical protein